jgi:hypothetical protein
MNAHDDAGNVNYLDATLAEVRQRGTEQFGLFARAALIGCYAGRIVVIEIDPRSGHYLNTTLEHRQVLQMRRFGNYMLGLVAIEGFRGVDYINHSCKANTIVQDRVIVLASRDIAPDEELTIDYREWDFVPEGIRCWCPEAKCII